MKTFILSLLVVSFLAVCEAEKVHPNDGIIQEREVASRFLHRVRRNLNHECYTECCTYEEVLETYKHNESQAEEYWSEYQAWRNRPGHKLC